MDLAGRISLHQLTESGSWTGAVLHKLVRALVDLGHRRILLNLREVTSVDSSGIGELFGSYTTVRNQGGVLKLTEPNERVRKVVHLTKLDTLVELIEDEATALRSFSKAEEQRVSGT